MASLQLRVNHERPLYRVGQDGGVLCGHVVRGQPDKYFHKYLIFINFQQNEILPLVVPLGDEGVVGEEGEDVRADVAEGERDLLGQLLEVWKPLPLEELQPDQWSNMFRNESNNP